MEAEQILSEEGGPSRAKKTERKKTEQAKVQKENRRAEQANVQEENTMNKEQRKFPYEENS